MSRTYHGAARYIQSRTQLLFRDGSPIQASLAENGYPQSRHRRERTPRVSEPKKRRASLLISDDSVWTNGEAGEMMKRDEVPDWPLIATYLISEASLQKDS